MKTLRPLQLGAFLFAALLASLLAVVLPNSAAPLQAAVEDHSRAADAVLSPAEPIVRPEPESGSSHAQVTQSPDRAALTALYNATDGENWRNNTNWMSDKPLGEWHGVTTDAQGRVTELVLGLNNLTGPIPPELGNLTNLRSLSLAFNNLTGPIPPELGNLTNLTSLWISGNGLTGPIPPELGNLTNLTILNLSYNEDLDAGEIPDWLSGFANLTGLGLVSTNRIGTIPSSLGTLANLDSLELRGNRLTGPIPPELGNLANLTRLWLSENNLTGPIPSELGNLGNLDFLVLSRNNLTGPIPAELRNLSGLWRLDLSDNNLAGPMPSSLTEMKSLTVFHFGNTGLCIPADAAFQTWLDVRPEVDTRDAVCAALPSTGDVAVSPGLVLALGVAGGSLLILSGAVALGARRFRGAAHVARR